MIRTPLTDLLGIRHPIVQTGMGYVSGARLTAATTVNTDRYGSQLSVKPLASCR